MDPGSVLEKFKVIYLCPAVTPFPLFGCDEGLEAAEDFSFSMLFSETKFYQE